VKLPTESINNTARRTNLLFIKGLGVIFISNIGLFF
jgi:hypothetical protein